MMRHGLDCIVGRRPVACILLRYSLVKLVQNNIQQQSIEMFMATASDGTFIKYKKSILTRVHCM